MRSDDFFLLSECCNRYRIIEQFGSRSDPKFCQALIRVQIDGKSYHNMTFIYNQIRFPRDSAHLFDTNFLIKQIRSKLRSEIVWHRFFAVPAFICRFRSCIAVRKLFLKTSPNFSSMFHGSVCFWQSPGILGKPQKCANRPSPVDDDCHIKYINIHQYASRLLGLFLNCSSAKHSLLEYRMFR